MNVQWNESTSHCSPPGLVECEPRSSLGQVSQDVPAGEFRSSCAEMSRICLYPILTNGKLGSSCFSIPDLGYLWVAPIRPIRCGACSRAGSSDRRFLGG